MDKPWIGPWVMLIVVVGILLTDLPKPVQDVAVIVGRVYAAFKATKRIVLGRW